MDFDLRIEEMMTEEKEKHKCPVCGSEKIESYKSNEKMYIKCDKCGHVLSEHKYRNRDIDYRSIIPVLVGIIIFTVIFAVTIRVVSSYMGIGP